MKILHLLSGGLDSTVMLYDLLERGNDVKCVLFNYGQRHVTELRYARATCETLGVEFVEVELSRIKGMFLHCALTDGKSSNVVVPNRNAILLNIACAIAHSDGRSLVTFGATSEDYRLFPDCRPAFVFALNRTLAAAGLKVRVDAPYIRMNKAQIVRVGIGLKVPLERTMSCYKGTNCAKCLACRLRRKALKACGL